MKPWVLAVGGLLGVIVGITFDFLLLQVPFVRNGYWTYLLLIPALVACAAAIVKQLAKLTMIVGLIAFLLSAGYSVVRFWPVPDAPPAVTVTSAFPDSTLLDSKGAAVRVADLHREGPVVVVLFRGAW